MRVSRKRDLKRYLLIFQNWYENSNIVVRLSDYLEAENPLPGNVQSVPALRALLASNLSWYKWKAKPSPHVRGDVWGALGWDDRVGEDWWPPFPRIHSKPLFEFNWLSILREKSPWSILFVLTVTIGKTSPMDQNGSDSDHTAVKGRERYKNFSERDAGHCGACVRVSSLGPVQRLRTAHSHCPRSCGSALRSDPTAPQASGHMRPRLEPPGWFRPLVEFVLWSQDPGPEGLPAVDLGWPSES